MGKTSRRSRRRGGSNGNNNNSGNNNNGKNKQGKTSGNNTTGFNKDLEPIILNQKTQADQYIKAMESINCEISTWDYGHDVVTALEDGKHFDFKVVQQEIEEMYLPKTPVAVAPSPVKKKKGTKLKFDDDKNNTAGPVQAAKDRSSGRPPVPPQDDDNSDDKSDSGTGDEVSEDDPFQPFQDDHLSQNNCCYI